MQPPTDGRRFQLVLLKASHYDDYGYVIRWWRPIAPSITPSNSLAAMHGIVTDLHVPPFEFRIGILEAKAAAAAVHGMPTVPDFLAQRIVPNVREPDGALDRVIAYANLFGREITLDTSQKVPHDNLRANDRHTTINHIQHAVAGSASSSNEASLLATKWSWQVLET